MGKNRLWNKALIISICFHLGIIPCICIMLNGYLAAPLPEKPIELDLVMSVSAQSLDVGNSIKQSQEINQPPKSEQKIFGDTSAPIKNEPVNNRKNEAIAKDNESVIDRRAETSLENSHETSVNDNASQAQSPASSPDNSSVKGDGGQTGKSGGYIRPQLLNKVEPDYPEKARTASREGCVSVSLEVLTNGQVGSVTVKQSSGHADLDEAAVKAAKRWRFVPAKNSLSGQPIACFVNFPVVFQIK